MAFDEAYPTVRTGVSLPGFELVGRGKVRDIYAVDDHLLIIATDRISAFDFILGSGIPEKGKVGWKWSRKLSPII